MSITVLGVTGVDRRLLITGLAAMAAGCASTKAGSNGSADHYSQDDFAPWSNATPEYALFPGDEIDISFSSAPELNRQLTIGPDGRVSLPMVGHILATDRSVSQLEADISAAYSQQLVRPAVEVSLRRAAPGKVWVDGAVETPGVYDIPAGQIDAYQAMVLAGGALNTGRASRAALIRRGADGRRMMTVVDLRARQGNSPIIQRGDIIYVPKSGLGELAAFFTQVRDAMPIGFSYALNGRWSD